MGVRVQASGGGGDGILPPVPVALKERFPLLYYIEILRRFLLTVALIGLVYFVYTNVPIPGAWASVDLTLPLLHLVYSCDNPFALR